MKIQILIMILLASVLLFGCITTPVQEKKTVVKEHSEQTFEPKKTDDVNESNLVKRNLTDDEIFMQYLQMSNKSAIIVDISGAYSPIGAAKVIECAQELIDSGFFSDTHKQVEVIECQKEGCLIQNSTTQYNISKNTSAKDLPLVKYDDVIERLNQTPYFLIRYGTREGFRFEKTRVTVYKNELSLKNGCRIEAK